MRVTARLSYGLGALVDLASTGRPVKGEVLAGRHGVSKGFLENILAELRRAGIVASKRGGQGGYWLARPARDITVADVIRTLDGVNGVEASVRHDILLPVWQSISDATMSAAEAITLDTVAAGGDVRLPDMNRDSTTVLP
ncbi:MAG TPA: Rrf2 family transcriptional regulator [Acidimicrobiales bacterium]|nr:Rrf2 family transcriptional regulator [Acidimicrobiales bacterium]